MINQDLPQSPLKAEARAEVAEAVEETVEEEAESDKPLPPPAPPFIDLTVLRQHRRTAPVFPLQVLGESWAQWATVTAASASAPVDYTVASLLMSAAALIGNARWAQGRPGWEEPACLWGGNVGDSGDGKTPGGQAMFSRVVPSLERKMLGDYPDRHRDWEAARALATAKARHWKLLLARAQNKGEPLPDHPGDLDPGPEPQMPRLRLADVTVEKVAEILTFAAPKGLLIHRDELAGFLLGMNNYHAAGRPFWLEAYNGGPFPLERVKLSEPLRIPHLTCSIFGTIQPERLATIMAQADDGLLSRFLWFWPDPVPFRMAVSGTPDIAFAINSLDRLRLLEMHLGEDQLSPVLVPLVETAWPLMDAFGQRMSADQKLTGGLLRSAYGKARGDALRLALVLEFLKWCSTYPADWGSYEPPRVISVDSFTDACRLVSDYFIPMAERAYGDAAVDAEDRAVSLLARWVVKARPEEVHVRAMQREVRLPGLRDGKTIHAACLELVAAGWLTPPVPGAQRQRGRAAYKVTPALWEVFK
jgi:hypothetical protein